MRTVAADITRPIDGLLEGADVVYHLVHSLGSRDFAERDHRAALNVAAEAERAGVKQIVYLGGLGDDAADSRRTCAAGSRRPPRSPSGPVPVTTLRAAVVVGRGSAGFETIVALVDRLPVMVAPRWVATPTQPIALADVIRYLVGGGGARGGARPELRRRRPGGSDLPGDDPSSSRASADGGR